MKKIIILLLIILLLPLMAFSETKEYFTTEATVINILKPPYYSGIIPTYYTIIVHNKNSIEIFFYLCIIKEISDIRENDIKNLDMEIGETYSFQYVNQNVDGYTYNSYKIEQNANFLLRWQKVNRCSMNP